MVYEFIIPSGPMQLPNALSTRKNQAKDLSHVIGLPDISNMIFLFDDLFFTVACRSEICDILFLVTSRRRRSKGEILSKVNKIKFCDTVIMQNQ